MEAVINKYQSGKIYTIRSPHTDKYYIGSTIEKYLSNRFSSHNSKYNSFLIGKGNNVTSYEILKLGEAYIELLELFQCNSKLELHKREGELIREHKLNCVNKLIAGRTVKEYLIDNKESIGEKTKMYLKDNKQMLIDKRHANREKTHIQQKQYRDENKEKIKEKGQKYNKDNADMIKEKKRIYCQNNKHIFKAYREANKDKINENKRNNRLKKKLETTLIDQIPN